jgi:multidrug efflux pump subunit AcrA (membrane-fusion protein)
MKKYIPLGTVILILGFIVFLVARNVIIKASQESQHLREISFSVSIAKAQKTGLTEYIHGQSIALGNPQVKVYPNAVTGLFIRNNFKEGDFVRANADLADIDRNVPGGYYNTAPVTSPIDGMIVRLYYNDKGASVSLDMPIAEVANINSIKIVVDLSEDQLFKVKPGQNVIITPAKQNTGGIHAAITDVAPFIDIDTLSGSATIIIDNKDRKIEIGTLVNVDIEIGKRLTFSIPQSAVLMGQSDTHIFVNKNNQAKKINITTGYIDRDLIEITGDIKEGDEIITEGSFKLFDGAKIRVVPQNGTGQSQGTGGGARSAQKAGVEK